jgi:hypothetical protein
MIGSDWLNKTVLGAPGWLAQTIHAISEYLCDGERGVIPSLRAFVFKSYGKYDKVGVKLG